MATMHDKPNPFKGDTKPDPKKVDLPHMPPKPEVNPVAPVDSDEEYLSDATQAEMKAGREATEMAKKQAEAEQEAGRSIIERIAARTRKHTPESMAEKE